jgi:glycerol kinase
MAQRLAALAFVFVLVAGYFLYSGLVMDTSTATGDGGTVANLQLMHVQAMKIGLGIGSAVIAALFAVGSAIVASRG